MPCLGRQSSLNWNPGRAPGWLRPFAVISKAGRDSEILDPHCLTRRSNSLSVWKVSGYDIRSERPKGALNWPITGAAGIVFIAAAPISLSCSVTA